MLAGSGLKRIPDLAGCRDAVLHSRYQPYQTGDVALDGWSHKILATSLLPTFQSTRGGTRTLQATLLIRGVGPSQAVARAAKQTAFSPTPRTLVLAWGFGFGPLPRRSIWFAIQVYTAGGAQATWILYPKARLLWQATSNHRRSTKLVGQRLLRGGKKYRSCCRSLTFPMCLTPQTSKLQQPSTPPAQLQSAPAFSPFVSGHHFLGLKSYFMII